MSRVMEIASSQEGHEESDTERLDQLIHIMDPTAGSLSLPSETFLSAAVSLKDQVRYVRAEGSRLRCVTMSTEHVS